ncbi:DUF2827 domain-containing protein [Variovorax sp. J22R133]|uniref:DUF2827 domain-containing protein n=1 Tax=Variovorax brevis TaxID=3053503 RepID=UPI002576FE0A|nr:DUF2827 domain-containing protein [Variovorax sp. J22R133]MDM0113023.1 DUF2827 domain-containing protein [Variovorax sp. J22R133]
MRIGISVITHTGQNIWENGMGQNVLFLAQLLQRIPFVERVQLIDVGDQNALPPQVDIQALGLELVRAQAVTHTLDVVIEMAGALSPEWLLYFRACGGKAAYMCVGQPQVGLAEPIIFTDKATFARHDRCDEVWLLPKDDVFVPMMRTLHRCPVHVVPYIWSPQFLAQRVEELAKSNFRFGYEAGRQQAWRLAIFEPNISLVKNCLVPMLVCDEAYRAQPHQFASMQVLNTLHLKDHPTMLYLANSLELVRQHKAVFHGRHDFAGFMVQHADAVVAHQWQNAQNYSYLDALYGGYPLIHNSPWLRDAGYYYPDFDIAAGAAQLLHAVHEHDRQVDDYRARSQRVFEAVDPDSQSNIEGYAQRLLHLVGGNPDFRASEAGSRRGAFA